MQWHEACAGQHSRGLYIDALLLCWCEVQGFCICMQLDLCARCCERRMLLTGLMTYMPW